MPKKSKHRADMSAPSIDHKEVQKAIDDFTKGVHKSGKFQVRSIGDELRKEITPKMLNACKEICDCFIYKRNGIRDIMWEDLYFSISALVREVRVKELKQLLTDQKAVGR